MEHINNNILSENCVNRAKLEWDLLDPSKVLVNNNSRTQDTYFILCMFIHLALRNREMTTILKVKIVITFFVQFFAIIRLNSPIEEFKFTSLARWFINCHLWILCVYFSCPGIRLKSTTFTFITHEPPTLGIMCIVLHTKLSIYLYAFSLVLEWNLQMQDSKTVNLSHSLVVKIHWCEIITEALYFQGPFG